MAEVSAKTPSIRKAFELNQIFIKHFAGSFQVIREGMSGQSTELAAMGVHQVWSLDATLTKQSETDGIYAVEGDIEMKENGILVKVPFVVRTRLVAGDPPTYKDSTVQWGALGVSR